MVSKLVTKTTVQDGIFTPFNARLRLRKSLITLRDREERMDCGTEGRGFKPRRSPQISQTF